VPLLRAPPKNLWVEDAARTTVGHLVRGRVAAVPAGPGRTGYEGPGPTLKQPHRPTANVPREITMVEHDRDWGTVHHELRWKLISPGAELGRSGPFYALSAT